MKSQNRPDLYRRDILAGALMLICAAASLIVANTSAGESYPHLWSRGLMGHSLLHWVNDGLMAVFFLLIGLELKRELLVGELRTFKGALLPAVAAIGGMVLPAILYFVINRGQPTEGGFAIPISTDIAFVVGILALLGGRVPTRLKVLLTSLAVVDDLGAIVVIALCYSGGLQYPYLMMAGLLTVLLLVFNKIFRIDRWWVYGLGGVVLWWIVMQSGVHSSITGILLAMAIPFRDGDQEAPAALWERRLHGPVYFVVLPLFVLANTAIRMEGVTFAQLWQPHTAGIAAGLLVGKPLGVVLLTWAVVKSGWSELPEGVGWAHIVGGGMLCGIGFTMSILIASLSFEEAGLVNTSKLTILLSSTLAAIVGTLLLLIAGREKRGHASSKDRERQSGEVGECA